MLTEKETVSLRADPVEAPAPRREPPQGRAPAKKSPASEKAPRATRRRWLRPALFLLLPLALIAGGYWYVTGGRVMSTDDSYVEADKVGVSTDVSGIVKEIDVTENQRVDAGQVLYRLDDLPFRLMLQRAEAQIGIVRNDLNALKANYQDMQTQIRQAQYDIDYYDREFRRQQELLRQSVASQASFDTARRNLQNAQQKLASLNQQLVAIAANLNGDPNIPVEQHPVSRCCGAARRGGASTCPHPCQGAVRRHRDECAFDCTRQVSHGLDDRLFSRRLGSRLGRLEPERDGVDLCTSRAAGHGDGRYLSGYAMGRHR